MGPGVLTNTPTSTRAEAAVDAQAAASPKAAKKIARLFMLLSCVPARRLLFPTIGHSLSNG
jgi:hypothetical protein